MVVCLFATQRIFHFHCESGGHYTFFQGTKRHDSFLLLCLFLNQVLLHGFTSCFNSLLHGACQNGFGNLSKLSGSFSYLHFILLACSRITVDTCRDFSLQLSFPSMWWFYRFILNYFNQFSCHR